MVNFLTPFLSKRPKGREEGGDREKDGEKKKKKREKREKQNTTVESCALC